VDWADDLKGKVALVTGAAQRVGAVIAEALGEAGADVVVNHYRMPEAAAGTVARIRQRGRRAVALEADISSAAACRELVEGVLDRFGRLDFLIHNASTFVRRPFLELTEDDFEESIGVGLRGPLFLTQAAARPMLAQGGGKVIALIGNSLYEAWPDYVSHAVAKAALGRLMELLAVALAPTVQCLGISPDRVLWTSAEHDASQRGDRQGGLVTLDGVDFHAGTAADVAAMTVALCKSGAYLNGAVIPLDGGKSRH
jgi:NAD(P)-dependent dehydrogenase (short-subunit alcohol dehydrogenase family)